jgi:diacylglycerol kinase family enzyme
VQLDGEPVDITAPLVFSIWPKSLNVLVPQVVPHPLLTFDELGGEPI